MDKLAIIGASYLQVPLIEKAKSMGLTTYVFAWKSGDIGEEIADYFFPISITERERILEKCREIQIDGICSIASDLAAITVNYVAEHMELTGNSLESTYASTNKHAMRERFKGNGDPSPASCQVASVEDIVEGDIRYPVIVKPVDRSGSRGITKLNDARGMEAAIAYAKEQSFQKLAVVEEFVTGREYSVECISWQGAHHFLAMTKKYTTGAPHFVETAHLEPAPVSQDVLEKVKAITFHALDTLAIRNGASHTELKISNDGTIKLIEIGGRMGGDCIGSDLVRLSTGIDFLRAVIQVALGQQPDLKIRTQPCAAAVRFICTQDDIAILEKMKREHPQGLICSELHPGVGREITDSSNRFGYYVFCADRVENLLRYLPSEGQLD